MSLLEADHWIFSTDGDPDFSAVFTVATKEGQFQAMSAPTPVAFLGVVSAEATISQLRQTKIQPSVIHLINLLLDEIISSLISTAQSINPTDIRINAVPHVFSAGNNRPESTGIKSLARECTAEAELEVRSWHEINPSAKRGFPPGTKGRGMSPSMEQANAPFPVDRAVDLMRLRVSELSGYSPGVDNFEAIDEKVVAAWKAAGGDGSPNTIEPASAWVHAFVERVCEKLLAQLNRVVERDSSIAICSPHDLYTALAEDERFWGWFARMNVKSSLDEAMKAASKPLKLRNDLGSGRQTPPNPQARSTPNGNEHLDSRSKASSSPISSPARGSSEASRLASLASVTRKGSSMTKRFGSGHDRKDSVLSVSSRGAKSDADEVGRSRSPQDDEDEFDALVRSGETMKVSLTPSRLKTFEAPVNGKKGLPDSPSMNQYERRPINAFNVMDPVPPIPRKDHGSPLVTPNSSPSRAANGSRSRSGSSQRLVARAATTIEERADEEGDSLPSKHSKKESLKELLDSNAADYATKPSGRRTVPAVILASPPPPPARPEPVEASLSAYAALTRKPSTNSTDRMSDSIAARHVDRKTERDDRQGARHKPRTEARELADFLNSVPPPFPPESRGSIEPPPTSAKSAKGFRGLMSKVTGTGSKKKEEEARIARENAAWEIPTAPRATTRHKKSMTSVSTTGTASPITFRMEGQDVPELPAKLRKRPDAGALGAGSSSAPSEKSALSRQASSTAIHHDSQTPGPFDISSNTTQAKPPLGVFSAVEGASKTAPNVPIPMPQLKSVPAREERDHEHRGVQNVDLVREVPTAASTPRQATASLDTAVKPQLETIGASDSTLNTPSNASPVQRPGGNASRSVSDANSFKTAPEGDGGVEDDIVPTQTPLSPSQTGSSAALGKKDSTERAQQISSPPSSPSIALERLVLARSLLRHATTADECRMLLDAYLTQIGVPRHADNDGLADLTGEAKVMAWLLDGLPGPTFQWPYSPLPSASTGESGRAEGISDVVEASQSGSIQEEQDEGGSDQATPKLEATQGGELDKIDRLVTARGGNEEEELVSETDSSASVLHDDDGSSVSVATSGTRSAVRLSTLGPVIR